MKVSRKKFLFLLAMQLILTISVRAQIGGKITGSVKDPSGSVVPGATVVIANAQTGLKSTTTTGADVRALLYFGGGIDDRISYG